MSEVSKSASERVDVSLYRAIDLLKELNQSFGKMTRSEIKDTLYRAFWHAVAARDNLTTERNTRPDMRSVSREARAALAMARKL